jgi:DNA-directed RNA polymerase specialized sigma subunit
MNDIKGEIKVLKAKKRNVNDTVSLDDTVNKQGEDNESLTLEDIIPNEKLQLDTKEIEEKEYLNQILSPLNEVEKVIILQCCRNDVPEKEIAQKMNHIASWVTKIKQAAFNKIKPKINVN